MYLECLEIHKEKTFRSGEEIVLCIDWHYMHIYKEFNEYKIC